MRKVKLCGQAGSMQGAVLLGGWPSDGHPVRALQSTAVAVAMRADGVPHHFAGWLVLRTIGKLPRREGCPGFVRTPSLSSLLELQVTACAAPRLFGLERGLGLGSSLWGGKRNCFGGPCRRPRIPLACLRRTSSSPCRKRRVASGFGRSSRSLLWLETTILGPSVSATKWAGGIQ